jgi:hypothetical protein
MLFSAAVKGYDNARFDQVSGASEKSLGESALISILGGEVIELGSAPPEICSSSSCRRRFCFWPEEKEKKNP